MTKTISQTLLALAVVSVGAVSNAEAGGRCRYVRYSYGHPVHQTVTYSHPTVQTVTTTATATASVAVSAVKPPVAASKVEYKPVQPIPKYDLSRPEVASGSRVTLFANFLRQEQGCVLFKLGGASLSCEIVDWQPESVTVELPLLGLNSPKNAEIQVILPDGRIAKTFKVVYVSQPHLVVHADTIPQPMPPAPAAAPATYAVSARGGLVLRAQ